MPKTLPSLRKRVDSIDKKLMELLIDRADLVKQIGKYKRKNKIAVICKERESEIINKSMEIAIKKDKKSLQKYLVRIQKAILRESRQIVSKSKKSMI